MKATIFFCRRPNEGEKRELDVVPLHIQKKDAYTHGDPVTKFDLWGTLAFRRLGGVRGRGLARSELVADQLGTIFLTIKKQKHTKTDIGELSAHAFS